MNEQFKGKRFSEDIDKILNGDSTADFSKAEEEYGIMLGLAQHVASIDYSTDSKLRQGLLNKLLTQMAEKKRPGVNGAPCGELGDDALADVAGGLVLNGHEPGCLLCECKRKASVIAGDTCPECGHSRACHNS